VIQYCSLLKVAGSAVKKDRQATADHHEITMSFCERAEPGSMRAKCYGVLSRWKDLDRTVIMKGLSRVKEDAVKPKFKPIGAHCSEMSEAR
jgi:hypothetical protein